MLPELYFIVNGGINALEWLVQVFCSFKLHAIWIGEIYMRHYCHFWKCYSIIGPFFGLVLMNSLDEIGLAGIQSPLCVNALLCFGSRFSFFLLSAGIS